MKKPFLSLALGAMLLVGCGEETVTPTDAGSNTDVSNVADTSAPAQDVTGGWGMGEDPSEGCLEFKQTGTAVEVTLCYLVGDTDTASCEVQPAASMAGDTLTLSFGINGGEGAAPYVGSLTLSDDGQTLSGMLINDDKCDPEGCEFELKRMTVACDENAL